MLLALCLAAGIVLLPLTQLLPLPPAMWTALPGRAEFAAAFDTADISTPWLGISLSPGATWRSTLALLPAITVFLSVLTLGRHARRALTLMLIAFGFVSVLVGLAQLTQGPESALRFYHPTNRTEAVGFFANRNHFAALLYTILPFTAAWVVGLAADRRPEMMVGLALSVLVFASLLLGLGMARSRAGLVLAMLAGLGSVALTRTGRDKAELWRGARVVFFSGLIGFVLILQFAMIGILQRLQTDLADDARWELTGVTWTVAQRFQPFGSGLGTFEPIYRMHETIDRLRPTFVNHAHNDYVELLLEAGWPAIAMVLGFVLWLAYMSGGVWRRPSRETTGAIDLSLRRAAMLAVVLLLLHSSVDYPLRTTALSTLFAFFCALMIPPVRPRPPVHAEHG